MHQLVQPQSCIQAYTDFAPPATMPLELDIEQLGKISSQNKLVHKLMGKPNAQVVGACGAAGGTAGGGVDIIKIQDKEKEKVTGLNVEEKFLEVLQQTCQKVNLQHLPSK